MIFNIHTSALLPSLFVHAILFLLYYSESLWVKAFVEYSLAARVCEPYTKQQLF